MVRRLLAAILCFMLQAIGASAADAPFRIGIITDMSGQYSDGNGLGSVLAARMAVQDFGGKLLGRPIEILSADHQNKPDVGAAIVTDWIDNKGVDLIAEGVNSSVALAVQNVTRARGKVFLISGAGSSELTGKECSPTTVHWTYDTYASSAATAKAVLARGGDTWFFITADYSFGHALQRDATANVQAAGGKVLGSVLHPFGTTDFGSYLVQAAASPAEVVALANAGSDFANSAKQAVEFGLTKKKQLVALQVTLTDVPAIGLATLHGILFTDSWYWNLNDATRIFAARFYEQRRVMPTAYQAGVYSSINHYLHAVQAAGTTDAAAVMAKMRATPVNDFFTRNGIVRADGRMVHDMYLMRFKNPAESKGKWDLYELVATVPGDQAFRPMSEGGCAFVKK